MELISHKINYKNPKIIIDGDIYIGGDRLIVENGDVVRIIFESVNSSWLQAVVLKTDKNLESLEDSQKNKSWALWYEKPDSYFDLVCKTKKKELFVYNAWKNEEGNFESMLGGGAMKIEDLSDGTRRYYCNDGKLDNDFDDLVFRIEIIGKKVKSYLDSLQN